ncbi:MAG: Plug domain-containing protein, partial [Cyclobacteriaceae bacterium]|nr:Plug domain-containing protein [Cyclobacteriaceae bacterium]
MKYYYVVLLFVILSAGCSTTSTTNTSNKGKDYSQYQNLADILRTQPGITVTGSGFNTKVVIRGTNSLQLDTRPLYIIDGVQIGRDYASANNMI